MALHPLVLRQLVLAFNQTDQPCAVMMGLYSEYLAQMPWEAYQSTLAT